MTITNLQQIIAQRPNKKTYQKAVQVSKDLNRLVNGIGLDGSLKCPADIESPEYQKARELLKKSTRDLFERILKLRGKVFSAKGGSRVFGLTPNQEEDLLPKLKNVRNGIPLRTFVETVLMPAWDTDPMGLCFVEISADPQNPQPYPTYKSSSCVYAIGLNGRRIEYVVFDLSKEEVDAAKAAGYLPADAVQNSELTIGNKTIPVGSVKYKRVVDDKQDYIIAFSDSTTFEIVQQSIIPNPWGFVPGFILSNQIDYNTDRYTSTLECLIELGNRYFERDSDLALLEKLHGTPSFWTHPYACDSCGGTKMVKGEPCKTCKGSGYNLAPKISSTLIVPESTQDQTYSIPPRGYVVPPEESFNLIQTSIDRYEGLMRETYWGEVKIQQVKGPKVGSQMQPVSATEIVSTNNKEEIRLNQISDWAQDTEELLLNILCLYYYPTAKPTTVNYGRRFVIASPDELRNQYEQSRTLGTSDTLLDDLYSDYLEAKYEKDDAQRIIQYKLFQLEPFFHYTMDELKLNIGFDVAKEKLLFGEWSKTKHPMEIFDTDIEVLRAEFEQYVASSPIKEPQPQTVI